MQQALDHYKNGHTLEWNSWIPGRYFGHIADLTRDEVKGTAIIRVTQDWRAKQERADVWVARKRDSRTLDISDYSMLKDDGNGVIELYDVETSSHILLFPAGYKPMIDAREIYWQSAD